MYVQTKRWSVLALAAAAALPATSANAFKIYWVQSFEDRIQRANLDGTGSEILLQPPVVFDPIAIAVDPAGGKFYFIQRFDDKVLRANLNGTSLETVLAPPQVFDPVAIAVDSVGGKVYCAQSFDDKIVRSNLNGTASETIVAPPISLDPVAVAVDSTAGKIYWAENPGNQIRRANLDGSNPETVVNAVFVADAVSIAVDDGNGKLYWAERSGDRIRRADTATLNANVVTFLDALFVSDPVSIALDLVNARIYWAEGAASRIRRADLTGTNISTILEPPLLFDPLSIAADPTPSSGVPPEILWNSTDQASRSLRFDVDPPATATGSGVALKVTMVDLQTPNPDNRQCCPAPNFHAFDMGSPPFCSSCTGEACPADGSGQGGCARWVGEPGEFREAQDVPSAGTFIGARLQCTPFYYDWAAQGKITVLGAEILPSSTYSVQAYGAGCKGAEYPTCPELSNAVTMKTHRSGDVVTPFNLVEPNGLDINEVINKFKGLTSTPKALAQLTQNVVDPYIDVGGLDVAAVVDAFKGFAYSHSGPCPCPSTVICGSVACPSLQCKTCVGGTNAGKTCSVPADCPGGGACTGTVLTCVKTCLAGTNAGDPCIKDIHCPGTTASTCGNPFCRDRCGRCK